MKVVLSRKGMDSRAGGIPSPILPDGTLLSLPIPNEKSGVPYGDLVYKGRTYQQIIQQIHPTFDFQKHPFCHLDPDIYGVLKNKHAGWKPAFGQYEIPAKHRDGQGVDVGDVFLFYGMFRKTEALPNGTLHFVKGAPIQHIIYGYIFYQAQGRGCFLPCSCGWWLVDGLQVPVVMRFLYRSAFLQTVPYTLCAA